MAIDDAPAFGRHQAVIDPVVVGEQGVVVGVERLQVVEPPGQRPNRASWAPPSSSARRVNTRMRSDHAAWLSRGM